MRGKTFKFPSDINTDLIIPAIYLDRTEAKELALHCMEGIDPKFNEKVKHGDFIIAGNNFGCGSSREHAPLAIKACGIGCVVAKSFARIFYRNAINIGLPILECPEAVDETKEGDELHIDIKNGKIINITQKKVFKSKGFSDFIYRIIKSGGLIEYTKKRLCMDEI